MKLTSIRIRNFKAINDCNIVMTDATVLVGPNNAGKSSILQAIHFASRSIAQATEANKQSTLSLSEIEYIPSSNYKELAHFGAWGNFFGSPESKISFSFLDDEDQGILEASVILKSARNEGISVSPTLPAKTISTFRGRETVFSSYIPGIAGIPLQEERLSKRHIFRKAASGDSNVVLRNILLLIKGQGKFNELLGYVREIYPNVDFDVSFDEDKDFHIKAEIVILGPNYTRKPLEYAGTGFLHVLQIFSYLVLFRPKIILIDEPESHLHPTLQTRLIRTLQKKVGERNCVALITTHSPFVARGLPLGSKMVWIDKGSVIATTSDNTLRDALGWGALDKPILLCTEDNRVKPLNEIISQDEDLQDKVSVFPFDGVSKLGSGSLLSRLREQLGNQHEVVVHRDRDCMTDDELKSWKEEYERYGISPWVTAGSDIEMYFCGPEYLSAVTGNPIDEVDRWLEKIVEDDSEEFQRTFTNKRREINKRIYEASGGSPPTEELWATRGRWEIIKGKDLISRVRAKVKELGVDEKLVGRRVEGAIVAADLLSLLRAKVRG